MTTLAEKTEKAVNDFISGLSEASQQTVQQAMQRLMESDTASHAKNTGDKAPDFDLPNASGGHTRLSDLLKQGPVVLSFYRGGWCPFCNLEFRALHDILDDIHILGANLIGVAPETLEHTKQTSKEHEFRFEALSDAGNKVAQEYGLLMQVDEAVQPLYVEWGIDVPCANGDNSYQLPVPATYVIDSNGTIFAAHVDKDYTHRMEPDAILDALRKLKQR